ncbi:M23 family metallopeptidase [Niallia sp. NCCP-28]|uniref:M23 family metallopeptidase n=1 Tax=Niallia sp. NCCP-28 TaxID=2934712 RepID=UPI0020810992|nr:M23 family metallopeptidase [Niallia sp. NCCP-28]GKU83658.1 stage II sporulation protein Q [Niallia sp. NCCP-28]
MREEENKRTSPDSKVKRFFKKRWAFPAVYIASAAIILSGVLWYQNSASDSDDFKYDATNNPTKQIDDPGLPVSKELENFTWPVADPEAVETQKQFYDNAESKEEQVDALVFYDNMYQPNTGIDLKMKDNSEFDVVASLSGTVTNVTTDSVLGNTIVLDHGDGIKTVYQSVKDIQVEKGNQVEKGDPLATSGQSQFNKEAGVHVHFEIRKNDVAVNPVDYFDKSLSALQSDETVGASAEAEENATIEENSTEKKSDDSAVEENSTDSTTDDNTSVEEQSTDSKESTTDDSADDNEETNTESSISSDPNA